MLNSLSHLGIPVLWLYEWKPNAKITVTSQHKKTTFWILFYMRETISYWPFFFFFFFWILYFKQLIIIILDKLNSRTQTAKKRTGKPTDRNEDIFSGVTKRANGVENSRVKVRTLEDRMRRLCVSVHVCICYWGWAHRERVWGAAETC